jgi:hypothetical protein
MAFATRSKPCAPGVAEMRSVNALRNYDPTAPARVRRNARRARLAWGTLRPIGYGFVLNGAASSSLC